MSLVGSNQCQKKEERKKNEIIKILMQQENKQKLYEKLEFVHIYIR